MGAQDAAVLSAALRDSLDALNRPLNERLSFFETAIGTTRRSRRRRRRMCSSSSDGEYSGGEGGRHAPRRSVTRALGRELEGKLRRRIPAKITPVDDRYAAILDCSTSAFANFYFRYDRTMAHGLARLRKDVSVTLGREAEWDGTPALGVFEFLSRFVKAGDDDDVSEGRALYLLPELTKGDLKRELYTIMPSLQGGWSGEVSSYMELINWLLHKYADEQSLRNQDTLFHGDAQEADETESEYYVCFQGLRRLCGYMNTEGKMKSRYTQGFGWEVRADVREHNTSTIQMNLLVQCSQRMGDVCRRGHQERRDGDTRRERRAARPAPRKYVTAAVTAAPQVGEAPLGPSRWAPPEMAEAPPGPSRWAPPQGGAAPPGHSRWAPAKVGEVPPGPSRRTASNVREAPPGPPRDDKGRPGRLRKNNCLACNMRGHVFKVCPALMRGQEPC